MSWPCPTSSISRVLASVAGDIGTTIHGTRSPAGTADRPASTSARLSRHSASSSPGGSTTASAAARVVAASTSPAAAGPPRLEGRRVGHREDGEPVGGREVADLVRDRPAGRRRRACQRPGSMPATSWSSSFPFGREVERGLRRERPRSLPSGSLCMVRQLSLPRHARAPANGAHTRPELATPARRQPVLFPTSLVGSYPQPDWLIDRAKLAGRFPPRVRAAELWRVEPDYLGQAQQDATLLAIRAQEDAGLDIITDGEIRRESYSNAFATALDGIDIDNPGTALDRSGHPNPVPRITGPIRRRHAVNVEALQVPARAHRPHHQDHRARPVHDGRAGAERLLPEQGGGRVRLRGGGQRRDRRPVRGRRRHRPARRAVPAGPAARPPRSTAWRCSTRRWTASPGPTAVHLCFGYAAIIHDRPSGYSFLPELAASAADQISIETAQSGLDCACWPSWPARRSSSACWT